MDAVDGCAGLWWGYQTHFDVNAADYQDAVFGFDFSCYVCDELALACIDLARFQRAAKSAHHSTGGGSDHVVQSCSMGFSNFCRVNLVVFGDGAVHAEEDRLRLAGQMGDAQGTDFPLNGYFGNVDDLRHSWPPNFV
jgi:hypothetical protein